MATPVLQNLLTRNHMKDCHPFSRNPTPQIQTKSSNWCTAVLHFRGGAAFEDKEGHKLYGLRILVVLFSYSSKMPRQYMTFSSIFCIDFNPVVMILKKIQNGMCNWRNDKFQELAYIRSFTLNKFVLYL